MTAGPSGTTCVDPWPTKRGRRLVESYDYVDEHGGLIEERARFEPDDPTEGAPKAKTFMRRWPAPGRGPGYVYKAPEDARIVIYRMPDVHRVAEQGGDVWWVEGEKDADNLANVGLTATTLGSSTARIPSDFSHQVKGIERLFILPDNDNGGRSHADRVAAAAFSHVGEVRIVELSGLPEHGDVSDFLQAGGTAEELCRAAEAAPTWKLVRAGSNGPPEYETGQSSGAKAAANELLSYAEDLIATGSLELFHDREGSAFATIGPPAFEAMRTFDLDARRFSSHLEGGLIRQRKERGERLRALTAASRTDALRTLEALALHQGGEDNVYLRIARLEDRIILDLGDESGAALEVGPEGWELVDQPSVRFRRSKTMRELPRPVRGGDLALLRSYVHVSDEDYPLTIAWVISALSGKGPNPLAVIHGEQGSGKSTAAKCLRNLVDPADPLLRALPHDERTLVIGAHSSHVLGFDNLSGIDPLLSDALCRIATGEGFAVRQLYSNREEEIFSGARPIVLTGIEEAASRPDLLDRSFLIEAVRTSPSERREERELLAAFELDRPTIVGCLLDGISAALRDDATVELSSSHRMVDAARWAQAAESGLSLQAGTIRDAIEHASASATTVAIDASPVALALISWYGSRQGEPWTGTATQLLQRLDEQIGDLRRPRGWPASPKGLSSALTRVVPNLRDAGIPIEFLGPSGRNRSRLWAIGGPSSPALDL